MTKALLALFFACMIIGQSSSIDSALTRADYLFHNRHLEKGNLSKFKTILDSLQACDSTNSEVLWRLGQYYYEIAQFLSRKQDRLDTLDQGKRFWKSRSRSRKTVQRPTFFWVPPWAVLVRHAAR